MPVFEEDSRVHELSDGGNFKVIFGSKFHSTLSFNNMTTADMTLTRLIKDRIDPFYVYPYPNPTIPDPIGGSTIDFIFFDGYTSAIGFLATNLPADYTSMTDGSEVTISGTKINGTFTLTSDMISETDGSSAFQIRYWKILFDCADPDMCCACDPILPATFVASSWNALGGLDTDFYGLAKESVVLETWAWVSGSIDKMTYLATGSASPDAPADGYSWNTITSFSGSSSGNIFIVADNLRDHSVSLVPDSIQTYPEQDQAPFRSKDIFYVEYINNPEPRIYDDQIMGVGTIIDIELGEV